jgi:acyl-CoA synthetase (NDP forming)
MSVRPYDAAAMGAFFTPKSVAVLGASSDASKFGSRILANLKKSGFKGDIYPVSRSESEVQGCKAYASLRDLPSAVDLVLLSIPAGAVPDAISDAQAAKARAAVVYAAGFGESNEEGRRLQQDLIVRLDQGALRMIGPNCMGVRNLVPPMNASNNSAATDAVGPVALLSQSGSFGNAAYASFKALRVGLSKFASIGNMVNVSHADLIRYCADDPATEVIAAFVEGIPDIGALLDAVNEVAPRKPIVMLKAGTSPFGARAALSHTGSLAADGRVHTALLAEAGAIMVEDMQEFFDTAAAFAYSGRHLPKSRRTAIFAVSGGPSVISADHCHREGLELPPLEERLASLRPIVPSYAALGNPVEVTGFTRGEAFVTCATTLASQDVVDSIIAISIGLDIAEFGRGMVAARALKPVVGCATGANLPGVFTDNGIPNYPSPERAVRSLRHLADRGCALPRGVAGRGKALPARELAPGTHTEVASKKYLASFGLPVTQEEEVNGPRSALMAAQRLGYPVALKVSSKHIPHKTERGGVILHLGDENAMRNACDTMARRFPGEAMLVQQMVPPGIELIIGARRSPETGPMIMLGIGGVLTEVLDDVVFCRAPATVDAVLAALARLRGQKLLDGYRGHPAVERGAIATIAATLSGILAGNPGIVEVDLNPVMITGGRALIVDALIHAQ